jgi:hypothetical protein
MACLDNTKWWGFPKSVQAALKVVLPESPEAEAQGWKDLYPSPLKVLEKVSEVCY